MQIRCYLVVFLALCTSSFMFAQSLRIDIGNRDYPIKNLHVASNKEANTPKFKKSFNFYKRYFSDLIAYSLFFDDYHLFHLEKQYDSDWHISNDIVLMPKYNIVLTKPAGELKITPYASFFKNGGFEKTGIQKIIHGIKVEKYRITPSFLNMEIWVGKTEETNRVTDFLRNLGLMNTIPTDEKIIAILHNSIEIDTKLLRYQEQSKKWLETKFHMFMTVPDAAQTERNNCIDKNRSLYLDTIDIATFKGIPKTANFLYKTKSLNFSEEFNFDKKVKRDTLTSYWNDKSAMYLQLYNPTDEKGDKFIYLRNQETALIGPIENGTFQTTEAKKIAREECGNFTTPQLINRSMHNGRELSTYIFIDKTANRIHNIIIDEKAAIDTSYLFIKYNLPKGEVVKSEIFSQYYRYTSELSTTKESKKITIDVKN